MKKGLLSAVFLISLLVPPALLAQEPSGDLESLLDFSITIKELNSPNPENRKQLLDTRKFYVIEGTLASIKLSESDDVELVLVRGEWTTDEQILSYSCFVTVSLDEWNRLISGNQAETTAPHIHDHILVVGYLKSYRETTKGPVPVFAASQVRIIP